MSEVQQILHLESKNPWHHFTLIPESLESNCAEKDLGDLLDKQAVNQQSTYMSKKSITSPSLRSLPSTQYWQSGTKKDTITAMCPAKGHRGLKALEHLSHKDRQRKVRL